MRFPFQIAPNKDSILKLKNFGCDPKKRAIIYINNIGCYLLK